MNCKESFFYCINLLKLLFICFYLNYFLFPKANAISPDNLVTDIFVKTIELLIILINWLSLASTCFFRKLMQYHKDGKDDTFLKVTIDLITFEIKTIWSFLKPRFDIDVFFNV